MTRTLMLGVHGLKIVIQGVLVMLLFTLINSLGLLMLSGVDRMSCDMVLIFFSYAPAEEILAYLKRTTRDNDLYKYMKFNHRVLEAIWDEDKGIWRLEIESNGNTISDWCHVLINGG